MKSTDWLPFETATGFNAAKTDFMPALFLESTAVKSQSTTDEPDYSKLSDSRLKFNASFDEFQSLQAHEEPRIAFEKVQQGMLDAINSADSRTEDTQKAFYSQVSHLYIKDGKPVSAVIERLQKLSAALSQILPGEREAVMAKLATGDLSPLSDSDLLDAYEHVFGEFAASSKTPLLKSWFDYRAAIGDTIGERQVFIGLNERFGSDSVARWQEEKVQELKDRVGGRYLWD